METQNTVSFGGGGHPSSRSSATAISMTIQPVATTDVLLLAPACLQEPAIGGYVVEEAAHHDSQIRLTSMSGVRIQG
jgi:hypothetical protein